MKTSPLMTLENIHVAFDQKTALEHIELRIFPQEIISLIGPNGAGKSTLVNVILGVQKPNSGTRSVMANMRVAHVPQQFTISPSMPLRVCDLLALEKADATFAHKVMEDTGTTPLLHEQVNTLSGGQLQRVLLARALLRKPALLVLDEPMKGLDPSAESTLYHFIRQIPALYGSAVFIVSHDLHWVMQGTHRVICLNKHICCSGLPEHIKLDPHYLALFGDKHFDEERMFYQHQHTHCQHENSATTATVAHHHD